MAAAFCPRGFLRRLDALVRADDGRLEDRSLTLAASAATPQRPLALPPGSRRSAPANRPLQLRSGGETSASPSGLHSRPRRGRRELVHRPADRADELLAGPFGKRSPAPPFDGRPRVEFAQVQRLAPELRHAAAGLVGKVRPRLGIRFPDSFASKFDTPIPAKEI